MATVTRKPRTHHTDSSQVETRSLATATAHVQARRGALLLKAGASLAALGAPFMVAQATAQSPGAPFPHAPKEVQHFSDAFRPGALDGQSVIVGPGAAGAKFDPQAVEKWVDARYPHAKVVVFRNAGESFSDSTPRVGSGQLPPGLDPQDGLELIISRQDKHSVLLAGSEFEATGLGQSSWPTLAPRLDDDIDSGMTLEETVEDALTQIERGRERHLSPDQVNALWERDQRVRTMEELALVLGVVGAIALGVALLTRGRGGSGGGGGTYFIDSSPGRSSDFGVSSGDNSTFGDSSTNW